MQIDKNKIYDLYMKWVDEVSEECDWKTHFTPLEIVHQICTIIESEQLKYNYLNFIPVGDLYDVVVKCNSKKIGELWPDVDGDYYFTSTTDGLWNSYSLIEIGNKLKEINNANTIHRS
jgi:hypothetical protein